MKNTTIRAATPADAEALLRIYSPYVLETAVSFEVTPPSLKEFTDRIEECLRTHAWLVCETDSNIVGYAYGSKHRPREAYQYTAEVSVYVDRAHHGKGIGRALYRELLRVLAERGFRLALGGVSLPNAASVALHESLGFEFVGIYKKIGYKFGRWHDTGWWQKPLGDDRPPNLK